MPNPGTVRLKPKPFFNEIKSPDEKRKFFLESAKNFCETLIWTQQQEYLVQTHITQCNFDKGFFSAWVPNKFNLKAFTDFLSAKKTDELFFSVSHEHANLFFKSKLLSADTHGFHFVFPEKLFKAQRRKDFRLPIPLDYSVKAEFPDPGAPNERISRRVFDISAGGISFMVPLAERDLYEPSSKIKNMTFKIRGRLILVDIEVRYATPVKDDSSHPQAKIGVQFRQIDAADIKFIVKYVEEEGRKYVSRHI